MAIKPIRFIALAALPVLVYCGGSEAPKDEAKDAAAPAAAEAKAAAPASSKGSASISGKVSYDGAVPAPEKVKLTADPKCAAMHKDGLERAAIKVKDGGLADVLVYVKGGLSGSYPAPSDPVLLDQEGCDYHPHMIVMQAGQQLKIRNSDETLHNIHPRPQANQEFNVGQPRKGMESLKAFDKPEMMIPVGCDVHPWMRAYISVLTNPFYAVTGEDGTYEIKDLPAGDYEIEAVHGKLKSTSGKISVKDGESARLDLGYKG